MKRATASAKGRAITENTKNARERLKITEASLRRHEFTDTADRFKRYLEGKARTLDEAFGLVETVRRGPKGKPEELEGLAWQIFLLRIEDKSWKEVADAFPDRDGRELQRIFSKHAPNAVRKAVARLDTEPLGDISGGK